ncbi:hypothetical protein [Demequina oxidasica]|uniref:hypothetical protein n=1 Tax=Demequina oxidasica TaxID=676199 RepID=UPI000783AF3E|nr:hypothetical protein [Demequina oxidasica]
MNDTSRLDRSDRIGMYLSVVLVAVTASLAIAAAVRRLLEVGSGSHVPVTVPLAGESTMIPVGPHGSMVAATIDSATIIVPDPAPATLFALYAQPIWMALAVCAGMVIAALFFLRLARGRAFSKGASALAYGGAAVIMAGWFGWVILTNMTTNGALSAVSDYTYDSVQFEGGLAPALVALIVGAIGAALGMGERLQRETEGLV